MTDSENNYSRLNRKKRRNRGDRILNVLNIVVILAILLTAYFIFRGGNAEKVNEDLPENEKTEDAVGDSTDEKEEQPTEKEVADQADSEEVEDNPTESGVITYLAPEDDKIVEVTIIDPAWEPIGTTQTGEHVSVYEKTSVDWKEKQEAIAQATGLAPEDTITLRIQNGGSPQKSIGIVSSKDQAEMYRVYLEWVDQKGWKTVKMDVLKTIEFDYKTGR